MFGSKSIELWLAITVFSVPLPAVESRPSSRRVRPIQKQNPAFQSRSWHVRATKLAKPKLERCSTEWYLTLRMWSVRTWHRVVWYLFPNISERGSVRSLETLVSTYSRKADTKPAVGDGVLPSLRSLTNLSPRSSFRKRQYC